jgi:hypothetical protein
VLEKTGFRHEGAWRQRQSLGVAGREDHVWFGPAGRGVPGMIPTVPT